MSVDKSFIISTEHMNSSLLSQNNLFFNDSDSFRSFAVIVDFVLPISSTTEFNEGKSEKEIIRIKDIFGRDVEERKNIPLFYIYDNGTVEKKIVLE